MNRSNTIRKIGLSLVAALFHCISFGAENNAATNDAGSKIRIGLAVLDSRLNAHTAKIDIMTSGPLPLNVERYFVAEIKAINVLLEIERTICPGVEQQFGQVTCTLFPIKPEILETLDKSPDKREAYKGALQALAQQNSALPPGQSFDALLVLEEGKVMDGQFDGLMAVKGGQVLGGLLAAQANKVGGLGVLFQERLTGFLQSDGYSPITYFAYYGRLYETSKMEELVWLGRELGTYTQFKDVRIPQSDLSGYLTNLPNNAEIENAIRKNISTAGSKVVKMLDLALWTRFKDKDPWEYIRQRRK